MAQMLNQQMLNQSARVPLSAKPPQDIDTINLKIGRLIVDMEQASAILERMKDRITGPAPDSQSPQEVYPDSLIGRIDYANHLMSTIVGRLSLTAELI